MTKKVLPVPRAGSNYTIFILCMLNWINYICIDQTENVGLVFSCGITSRVIFVLFLVLSESYS